MSKTWAVLATVAAVTATGISTPSSVEAGDIGPGLAIGVAALPYDGYVYGPLPYGKLDAPGDLYGSRVYHGRRVHRGSRIPHGARVHSVTRVHHVARTYRVFDPYYGGGPFYYHHLCCRYW